MIAWLMNQLLAIGLIEFHLPWISCLHLLVDVIEQVLVLFRLCLLDLTSSWIILLVLIASRHRRNLRSILLPLTIPCSCSRLLLHLLFELYVIWIEHAILMNIVSQLCNGSFQIGGDAFNAALVAWVLIALVMTIWLFYFTSLFLMLVISFIWSEFDPAYLDKVIWRLGLAWKLLVDYVDQAGACFGFEFRSFVFSDSGTAFD